MYALVDCNNFYASCERLFRPDLKTTPIVVLSNNDGCVIARSNEAKALGIAMGEPFFKVKALCSQHNIAVFSSNYTLYGDLSHRVMTVLQNNWPHLEIYSIDEAFLDLKTLPLAEMTGFCERLQKTILQYTGIPTSIGIGATKTLAKAANYVAKRVIKTPVFNIHPAPQMLNIIDIQEVWGIGRQWTKQLNGLGVHTAFDLANISPHWLKIRFGVVLARTAMELAGIECAGLEPYVPKKSIVSSKSFGSLQTELTFLLEAVSCHCARAYEKLRQEKLVVKQLSVFVQSNRYRQDLPQYANEIAVRLINPTDDLRLITRMAMAGITKLFKPDIHYKKVGVMLLDLQEKKPLQPDLWHMMSNQDIEKVETLMNLLDKVNKRYGRNSLYLASEGSTKPWSMKRELKSPNYTTNWNDIAKIK